MASNSIQASKYEIGDIIIEGKTKRVHEIKGHPDLCYLFNKDRITAGDGVRAHDLKGKATVSNETNRRVFEILNSVGVKTAFVDMSDSVSFVSKKCEMIPIEWVTRRLATGSFLKRNTGVPEGFKFFPPKYETFFKDDANHDPQWSEEQIIANKFVFNGVCIGREEVDIMRRTSILVFEILEKFWATKNCALIDMKIEFGVDNNGNLLVADVIDSDSWRLWPAGDKRLMVDKQVYRNFTQVTSDDLAVVIKNFTWVKDQLENCKPTIPHVITIMMGSPSDKDHCLKIGKYCQSFGLNVEYRVTSAHKGTEDTLSVLRELEIRPGTLVLIAVAGRSNGLGPVLGANASCPVINCPPPSSTMEQDIWSSLSLPSGVGCTTVITPEAAALGAAQIVGQNNFLVWSRIRVKQLETIKSLKEANKKMNTAFNT